MTKLDLMEYIENNTLKLETSSRGGGIEIDLAEYLKSEKYDDYKMTAYQNYLGGGMLGSIQNSFNFQKDELPITQYEKLEKMIDALNRYFHNLTNHEGDQWESATFEENQSRSASAY